MALAGVYQAVDRAGAGGRLRRQLRRRAVNLRAVGYRRQIGRTRGGILNWVCPRCSGTIDPASALCGDCGYALLAIPFSRKSKSERLAMWALRREASRLSRDGYELRPASVEWVIASDEVDTDEALVAGCLFGWLGGRMYFAGATWAAFSRRISDAGNCLKRRPSGDEIRAARGRYRTGGPPPAGRAAGWPASASASA